MTGNGTRGARRRGAILSMELVLVLPIFLTLVFAIVEFSLLASARTRVTDAARHGARLMCLTGASSDDVRQATTGLLGVHLSRHCQVDIRRSVHAGEVGSVHVQVPMRNATPDLLWFAGFSVSRRFIHADASMVMERGLNLAFAE